MKLLIDTNVIMDVLTMREPHFESSAALLRSRIKTIKHYIIASQTTDIFYLLRRAGLDSQHAKEAVLRVISEIEVISIMPEDVQKALASEMADYEDALLAYRANRLKADYIVTRNVADFALSPVPAITPTEYISNYTR